MKSRVRMTTSELRREIERLDGLVEAAELATRLEKIKTDAARQVAKNIEAGLKHRGKVAGVHVHVATADKHTPTCIYGQGADGLAVECYLAGGAIAGVRIVGTGGEIEAAAGLLPQEDDA